MKTAKKINIPDINQDLAYLCGVLAGDGYIGIRKHKHDYVVNCGGNPKNEVEFYDEVIAPLFFKLFNIKIKPKLLSGTYGFNVWSKNLVYFLVNNVGLPISPKDNISFPNVFLSDNDLALSFIRGLADTDFSIVLRNGRYPIVKGCSKSKELMKGFSKVMKRNGFNVCEYFDYKNKDIRLKKGYNIINRIEIAGHKQFSRWIDIIGTNQPKNIKKIETWKKASGERI